MKRNTETNAIILKSSKFGEINKLLTLFSPNLGIIQCSAYGALKLKSRFAGKLEQYTVVRVKLYQNKNSDFYTLKEVDVLSFFECVRGNLDAIFVVSFWAELLLKLGTGGEDKKIFSLFYNSLLVLDDKKEYEKSFVIFLYRYLYYVGIFIYTDCCSECGKTILDNEQSFVSYEDYHPLCKSCINYESFVVTPSIKEFIKNLMRNKISISINYSVSKAELLLIKKFLLNFIKFTTGLNFKSISY